MSHIKAVIFDMDGVLIDARDWHYEALNKALNLFGMEISRYDHLVTYDGLPTKKKLEMLTIERGLPRRLHAFINDIKQQYTMELVHTRCKPTFNHQFALSRLRGEGYRMAVCSNAIRKSIEVMLDKAGLQPFIDFTLSAEDVSRPKPYPDMYSAAISRLEVEANECLIVEDNENGVKAALASGAHLMRVFSVTEVNYQQIKERIAHIEQGKAAEVAL